MIAVDTNVLLRRLLNDDATQAERARRLFESEESVLIADVVLAEAVWTLTGKRYGAGREEIAAVVIGGTALAGGSGSIFGTFLGAAIMSVLRNGLVLLGVSSYWQVAAIGAVILIAVVIDTLSKRTMLLARS